MSAAGRKDAGGRLRTPFHHAAMIGLACFWPLAVVPCLVVTVGTGDSVYGAAAAFAVNSLLTALFYAEDKYLARHDFRRIPEKCLHIWEFLCGWPGAWCARQLFRHKSSKTRFLIVSRLCTAANIAALFLFFYLARKGYIPRG